jgi:hypothetical protein
MEKVRLDRFGGPSSVSLRGGACGFWFGPMAMSRGWETARIRGCVTRSPSGSDRPRRRSAAAEHTHGAHCCPGRPPLSLPAQWARAKMPTRNDGTAVRSSPQRAGASSSAPLPLGPTMGSPPADQPPPRPPRREGGATEAPVGKRGALRARAARCRDERGCEGAREVLPQSVSGRGTPARTASSGCSTSRRLMSRPTITWR